VVAAEGGDVGVAVVVEVEGGVVAVAEVLDEEVDEPFPGGGYGGNGGEVDGVLLGSLF
jgi:hypothetical protein